MKYCYQNKKNCCLCIFRYDHTSNKLEPGSVKSSQVADNTICNPQPEGNKKVLPPKEIATVMSKMVTLKKHGELVSQANNTNVKSLAGRLTAEQWVSACEFVPGRTWTSLGTYFKTENI